MKDIINILTLSFLYYFILNYWTFNYLASDYIRIVETSNSFFCYKVINYLSSWLHNHIIIFQFFLVTPSWIYFLIAKFFFIFNSYEYLYFFSEDQLSTNTLLINKLNEFHPCLLYFYLSFLCWSFVYLSKILLFAQVYTISYRNFPVIWNIWFITLCFGSWWSFQEGNWGGWWGWDFSEFYLLLIGFLLIFILHVPPKKPYLNLYLLNLIIILLFYILIFCLVQLNLTQTSHNFTAINTSIFLNTDIWYVLVIYFSCILVYCSHTLIYLPIFRKNNIFNIYYNWYIFWSSFFILILFGILFSISIKNNLNFNYLDTSWNFSTYLYLIQYYWSLIVFYISFKSILFFGYNFFFPPIFYLLILAKYKCLKTIYHLIFYFIWFFYISSKIFNLIFFKNISYFLICESYFELDQIFIVITNCHWLIYVFILFNSILIHIFTANSLFFVVFNIPILILLFKYNVFFFILFSISYYYLISIEIFCFDWFFSIFNLLIF